MDEGVRAEDIRRGPQQDKTPAAKTHCICAAGAVPVAVPGVRLADGAAALHTDRGHSLCSLYPPLAADASLPPPYNVARHLFDLSEFTNRIAIGNILW